MTERKVSNYLSKSLYTKGRRCHKALWLQKHQPELKDEPDETLQARFQSGHEVGALAQQLFPGGVVVPYGELSFDEQLAMTRKLIEEGKEIIYEAAFQHDRVFVKVDILRRVPAGWEVLEVKQSTSVKEEQCWDAALQHYVVSGAGLAVAKTAIVHLNNRYERRGALDPQGLFTVAEITDGALASQANVASELADMRAMLAEEMPAIAIGSHCNEPYACDFHGHCWRDVPEDSVFDLRGHGVDSDELYRQGIVRLEDLQLDTLNSKQRQQVESALSKSDFLDKAGIQEFLDDLWFPRCFLDFETIYPAIPLFDGLRPYQQMPFQYSLHIQRSADSALEHHEFLAQPGIDPREALIDCLLEQLPEGACIIAWNQSFEKRILGELAQAFPDRAPRIVRLLEAFRDPITVFRARTVYRWQQKGSNSLKDVLPALVPELNYEGMAVANGDMAVGAYHAMSSANDPQEFARIRKALLEYCGLDTMAMVKIVEKLRELAC